MKPLYLLVPALLLTQALCAQTTAEKLAEYMDAAYKAKLFNGVVLATRNDSIILAKGYGWRDYENHIPHDINSVFCIGSIIKTFTSQFFQEKKDFFFTKQANCQLEFERDVNGKITDVLLYFNKRKVPHWKIK